MYFRLHIFQRCPVGQIGVFWSPGLMFDTGALDWQFSFYTCVTAREKLTREVDQESPLRMKRAKQWSTIDLRNIFSVCHFFFTDYKYLSKSWAIFERGFPAMTRGGDAGDLSSFRLWL